MDLGTTGPKSDLRASVAAQNSPLGVLVKEAGLPLPLLTALASLTPVPAIANPLAREGGFYAFVLALCAVAAGLLIGLRIRLRNKPSPLAENPRLSLLAAAAAFLPAAVHLSFLQSTAAEDASSNGHLSAFALGLAGAFLPGRFLLVIAAAAYAKALWPAMPIPFPDPLYFSLGLLLFASLRFYPATLRWQLGNLAHSLKEETTRADRLVEQSRLTQLEQAILLENSPDLLVSKLTPQGGILVLGDRFKEWTGLEPNDHVGADFSGLFIPAQRRRVSEMVQTAAGGQQVSPETVRMNAWSGRSIEVRVRIMPQIEGGKTSGLLATVQSLAEKRKLEKALKEAHETYSLTVEGSNEGLWHWDLNGNRMFFSRRWKAMLGYSEEEISADPNEWLSRVHREDISKLRAAMLLHINGDRPEFLCDYRILHRNGTYRWMVGRGLAQKDHLGNPTKIAGSQTDVTEFKINEQQLLHDAFHDSLTGLANRAMLMDRLERALQHYERDRTRRFAVLFLDLDRFKVINDSLGHDAGDQLLVATANRLRKCIREVDTVARLGGDEFTVLLEEISSSKEATHVASRIHEQLKAPFNLNGVEVFSSASIGIAICKREYRSAAEVLRDADTAMYRAKMTAQAPRHQVFNTTMHAHAVELLQLENDLRRAVEREEFEVHYQPVVAINSGEIKGFEALVRWMHPRQGLIMPGKFLKLAEETGLIIPMTWWILGEACRQAKAWQGRLSSAMPLSVNINVSASAFAQNELLSQIKGALKANDLPSHCLNLEITEGALMEDAETVVSKMKQIKALQVGLHLDDFGTGYSSLSYLHRFPLDVAKIDRSFVRLMEQDGETSQIVSTIVNLSHNLGMEVVAEGVETLDQLSRLKQLGCEYAQGYLYSKPVNAAAAEKLMLATARILRGQDSSQQPASQPFLRAIS